MKKIISAVAIIVLCFSFSTNTYAKQEEVSNSIDQEALALASAIDITEELQNAHEGIIDSNISQEVLERISVTSNDNIDISYTVRHLGSVARGEVYTLTASSKTVNGSVTEDYVDCWISMTWIDNFGPSNELVAVSGGWNANGRTLSNRQVWYGVAQMDGALVDGLHECQFPSGDTYDYTPTTELVGFSLKAYSWVNSAGYPHNIYCGVKSSITD